MPSRNIIKTYLENGFYHIYNRGANKQPIFYDEQDYAVFLSYLKEYLLPKDEKRLREILSDPMINWKEKDKAIKLLRLNNFADEIILLTHCLMPNHFHFLIKQKLIDGIDRFMSSLGTRYTMFFNKKYKHIGPLYQSTYKAAMIESDEQLLYTTGYIHRNPSGDNLASQVASQGVTLQRLLAQPSSLPEYLGQRKTDWIHPEEILSYFSKKNPRLDYLSFVQQTNDFSFIHKTLIDE